MNRQAIKRNPPKPVFIPIAGGILQRCTATTECNDCRKRREGRLQRIAVNESSIHEVPPIVHEVLHTPGRPLDPVTRAFLEPRFEHDFSQVRIHTDAKAAESALAVNALAYTVGRNVVFGEGRYAPRSSEGQRLIAHEIVHVMQQSTAARTSPIAIGPKRDQYESQADNIAQRVAGGIDAKAVNPSMGSLVLQRVPAPTPLTNQQQRIVDVARRAAAIRCQIAMFRVRGIDPVIEWRMRARSLARLMFEWNNPNMEQIDGVISSMVGYLTSGVQILVAPANDHGCGGNHAAYVRGLRPPIVLCPNFFSSADPEHQIRTMIHEAAHLARIGSANLGESYCVDFDCETSCGGFNAADSWAHFVHCLSGQVPDQPITIRSHTTSGNQAQPPSQRNLGGRR